MFAWFALARSERETLLGEPWDFATWLDATKFAANRMFRHAVLFLLFPDEFEPIVSNQNKRQIVAKLHMGAAPSDPVAVDRAIHAIRERLEEKQPDSHFYYSPIRELWQDPAGQRPAVVSTSSGSLNTILYGPPDTGKTYRTVSRCVEVCDGCALEGAALRERYESLVDEGRVRFVTFHQSYGYEGFVHTRGRTSSIA